MTERFSFKSTADNADTGVLEVSMDAHFLINDGQHRKSAIMAALKEDSTLGDETISIGFLCRSRTQKKSADFYRLK